jgi:hypothetical protein
MSTDDSGSFFSLPSQNLAKRGKNGMLALVARRVLQGNHHP